MSQFQRKKSIIEFLLTYLCPTCSKKHLPFMCIQCHNVSPECLNCLLSYTKNIKKQYISTYQELTTDNIINLNNIIVYYDEIIEKLLDTIVVCKVCI